MLPVRVIPILLLRGRGLVKTVKFKDPVYVGDPLNTVRLFNDKEVDELICVDITASRDGGEPNFDMLADIASECFMPFGFGGGVRTLDHAKRILGTGAEKVVVNTQAIDNPALVEEIAGVFGSQAVIASIDARKTLFGGYEIATHGGSRKLKRAPEEVAHEMEQRGAGEILINSIDRDGTREGFDIALIRRVSAAVQVPVVACGGAGKLDDFRAAVRDGGADAVAAGSFFVFRGKHKAVLITYPAPDQLAALFE